MSDLHTSNRKPNQRSNKEYLALGDSYTIGAAVSAKARWPNQLAKRLEEKTEQSIKTTIIAKTGWTTNELIDAVSSAQLADTYDLVSLLIGVNNQYRGYSIYQYEKEFEQLLLTSIRYTGDNSGNVFVLSIPDYGITPFAADLDQDKIASEINKYNQIAKGICKAYQVEFTDITEISRMAVSERSLIADDDLHPSAMMYEKWVEKALPLVLGLSK
jgi:lysophospholipase L1-like esterase